MIDRIISAVTTVFDRLDEAEYDLRRIEDTSEVSRSSLLTRRKLSAAISAIGKAKSFMNGFVDEYKPSITHR